jgi:hypothetical protein
MHNNENKIWYSRQDIMNIYPIGISTYKKRIKLLGSHELSGYTRLINLTIPNSNLKSIKKREIHRDILETLFSKRRIPSKSNIPEIIKWVCNFKWDWFGVVIPCNSYPIELKGKMNYLSKQLRKICKKKMITLFYSIEKNKYDEYYHCHFLISDELNELTSNMINKQLELIAEPNTKSESRIYLKKYDHIKHGNNGSRYSMKMLEFGFEILK